MKTGFGSVDGKQVYRIEIGNEFLRANILTYGASLQSLFVPDSSGNPIDVVLGYDSLEDYVSRSGRVGATIGRFANRIGDAKFSLNGREYNLTANRGQDHIHGGNKGFDKRVWDIVSESDDSVTLKIRSEDGEEGYPGNLDLELTYSVKGKALVLEYLARSDSDTVCNITNHSYFNLAGEGTIEDHEVTLDADYYTDTDDRGIPTGQIIPVGKSRFDLREPSIMGNRIYFEGYDVNYLLNKKGQFATVYCGRTGITMTASTDMPAVQFYTADGLKECTGKMCQTYGKHSGLCLETQFCPDSPNNENFPSCVLRKGEEYRHRTEYGFV